MNSQNVYKLFDEMIVAAKKELMEFTVNQPFTKEQKADKSIVTACDKAIDTMLSAMARDAGFQVISEERSHAEDILHSGNYFIIDPIDATNRYIQNVNYALEQGSISHFLQTDLGADHDFGLLIGIVENGLPRFGAVYVYTTGEKIFIDGEDKNNFVRENNVRSHSGKNVVYTHREHMGNIQQYFSDFPDVTFISQSAYGIKSVYTIINNHENAIAPHRKSNVSLWDVLPAAVAARAFGGVVYDGEGKPLKFTEYIPVPPKGATVIKGNMFESLRDRI